MSDLTENAVIVRGRAAATAIAWRWQGRLWITAVVKATFSFAADTAMSRIAPQEIFRAEVHHDRNPARSVRFSADLAPRLLRADVLFTGHAHAAGPVQPLPVRLALSDGQRLLLDKPLQVQERAGVESVPIVYERAVGGIGEPLNPVGVGSGAASILDPRSPRRPAGYGPIARTWLARRGLLGPTPRAAIEAPIATFPDTFTWAYFQAAPEDQRIDFPRGDEWIVLEGLNPRRPILRTRLPAVRGCARVHGLDASSGAPSPRALTIDTLRLDGDEETCTVVCRASFVVPHDEMLGAIQIEAGIESAGEPIPWAAGSEQSTPDATYGFEGTLAVAPEQLERAPLPFQQASSTDSPFARPTAEPQAWEASGTLMLAPDANEAPAETSSRPSAIGYDGGSPLITPSASPPSTSPEPSSAAKLFHQLPSRADAGEALSAPALQFSRGMSDTIPIVTRTPFVAFTIPVQVQPPRDTRTVVVKGTFDIVPGGPAQIRSEADPPSGDVNAGGDPLKSLFYPSDFAIFKPRADVILKGHAYAPGGHSPAAEVRFRFGHRGRGFDRRVAVFGERRWQRSVIKLAPTPPKPFEKMPLVYERAFGGPDREQNPVGLGSHDLLPNLEDPDHLVTSPDDAPAPACFAGIPVQWHPRRSKLGTYDARWRETRWPYFPEDFDWTHFQAAPAEQQLEALEGDEPFELVGMHPEHPVIRGSLPRIRPRCFMQATTAAGAAFREVVLRLDTVSFDVDEMKLNLVWRGLLDVIDDDASDVAELFVMREEAGTKRIDLEEAYAKYLATRIPLDLVAESPEEPPPRNDGAAPEKESALERIIRDKLRAAGLAGAAAFVAALTEPEPDAESALDPEAGARAHLAPELDPIRAQVVARLASGEPLDALDLAGANLSDLDFSDRSLSLANLKEARLCRCRFARADLSGAQLTKADLEGAMLDGATLSMADLTGANLAGASVAGAEIAAADFSGARGDGAIFRGARGARARFQEGSWKGARFDRAELAMADFTRAALDDAVFDGAVMPKITLYDARGTHISWKGADLTEARADGASLVRSAFFEAIAPSSKWEGAVLDGSTFLDAVLTGASLPRASCARVVLSGADLVGARLMRAKLPGASLLGANLMNASLESADLTGADLRGANLHGAETWKAKLRGARLELAIVTQTKLSERSR